MVSSSATTVQAYLEELPVERRAVIEAVRNVVLAKLPAGYEETMRWGMISYEIPLVRYPETYNKQPLGYVGLAAQKNNYALYLMGVYGDHEQERVLREAYDALGRKPDIGKSCVRFRRLEHLPLEAVGQLVASMPVDRYIAHYEANRS